METDLYYERSSLPSLSIDPELGFGLSWVRFEAEYPKSGFGILRLTPKYEPMPLWGLLPEKVISSAGGGKESLRLQS